MRTHKRRHRRRYASEGTVAWPVEEPTPEQLKRVRNKERQKRKPLCTDPNLLHARHVTEGTECNMWQRDWRLGRGGEKMSGVKLRPAKRRERCFP